ncbi:MAG: RNA methyltransferase [Candidatus Micrarchaeota archaeon]|nr:RNA methyltransferase [Candidatus Micrarchaeota archaeon]
MSQGRFRIVLVEPEYEINVGSVARAMKNFGFSELFLVKPKCDHLGFDAVKFSKHARDVLEGAKVVQTLEDAFAGCKFRVGTTGVLFRHWDKTIRSPIPIKSLASKLKAEKEGRVAILFGNEGTGLSEQDISACDFLATIPTSSQYPVLNLSHAAAIVLYELSGLESQAFVPAGEKEKEKLIETFFLYVERYAHAMRNPRKAKIAFRRMVGKSMLTDKECASILGVLRRAYRELPAVEAKRQKNRCHAGRKALP